VEMKEKIRNVLPLRFVLSCEINSRENFRKKTKHT